MKIESQVQSWRAVEALRAGVPNRDAVQKLGSSQGNIEARFRKQLMEAEEDLPKGRQAGGTLVSGDFGSGKSHLLEYLQHIALESGFVCSKVVISKETPLYDPGKVYRAAIQAAKVPGRTGAAMTEITQKLRFESGEYARFVQWLSYADNGLSTHFPATVRVFEKVALDRDPEISDRMIQFWCGDKLSVRDLRSWLRRFRESAAFPIARATTKELARQRYLFAPRLMAAAGYAGWVLLIDEVELIGRYSLKQRAKSYGQVARLLGKLEGESVPGLTTVLSITEDFEESVLDERNDEEKIRARLAGGNEEESLLGAQAERGMRIIRHERELLEKLTKRIIEGIYDKVRIAYNEAYEWEPAVGEIRGLDLRIRQHIKRWINEWDLRRLYPGYEPVSDVEPIGPTYDEQRELEEPSEEEAPSAQLDS